MNASRYLSLVKTVCNYHAVAIVRIGILFEMHRFFGAWRQYSILKAAILCGLFDHLWAFEKTGFYIGWNSWVTTVQTFEKLLIPIGNRCKLIVFALGLLISNANFCLKIATLQTIRNACNPFEIRAIYTLEKVNPELSR